MVTMVVQHKVKDYTAWRRVYDDFAAVQKLGGVIEESVHRAKGDPKQVLVLHRFRTMAEAEAFGASPQLREAMSRAGVEGAPRIELFEDEP
jgi:antibiotic biosynthesis monooxygenase